MISVMSIIAACRCTTFPIKQFMVLAFKKAKLRLLALDLDLDQCLILQNPAKEI